MSKFSDFFGNEEAPAPVVEGEPFDGVYECQTCGKVVTNARRIAKENLIKWVCSEGHESSIKLVL